MNKQPLILGITILLLAVGLSGCEEKSNVEKMILGSWKVFEVIATSNGHT